MRRKRVRPYAAYGSDNTSPAAFSKADGNLVVRHDFLLDDNRFTEAKIAIRYRPEVTDPDAEASLTLTQAD